VLTGFLYELRGKGLEVSTHEWQTLMQALAKGLHQSSLDGFYRLSRSICVKKVSDFDIFDEAFLAYFKDVHRSALEITEELLEWLRDPANLEGLSEEQLQLLNSLDLDELRRQFEERLREQKERHDGGNRWIGTRGRSPFGREGKHPSGMRVGPKGGGRSAMQIAAERRFRDYRRDRVLDVRQIDVALRKLRRLGRDGMEEELALDETVDATCKNAGDLELVFQPPKRNRLKLTLLMDVGGSMDPHSELAERLFTAASRSGRFARFRHYYFHNCVYDQVYEDARFRDGMPVSELIATSRRDERLVVVGDALMHPAELMAVGGSIYYYDDSYNRTAGIEWLRRLADHFRYSAWLNPEPERFWPRSTIEMVAHVIPMWTLTLQGLDDAVRYLVRGGAKPTPPESSGSPLW
jgi:uncharacterized protein with von Willebrand factor type A (vWA) domain